MLPLCAQGQYVRLFGDPSRTAFYVDLDHVWTYNLYEASRWGLGGKLTHEKKELEMYVGYGLRDRRWKWGVGAKVPLSKQGTLTFSARRDYDKAASRSLEGGSLTNPGSLSAFMTRRLCDNLSFRGGYSYKGDLSWTAEVVAWLGRRLFDGGGLLYLADGDTLVPEDGTMLRLTMSDGRGLAAELRTGVTWPIGKPVARLVVQYDKNKRWQGLTMGYYVQTGVAAPGSSYTQMFDLGGTYGSPICFNHALQTALPNEFTASLFVLGAVRLSTVRPLWDLQWKEVQIGTHPTPFVQLTAAWGGLWGQDSQGQLFYEGLPLQAPNLGIAEPAAGVDGLVRWGLTDWGLAAAYRLTPAGASYNRQINKDNLTLLLTVKLIL